MTPPNEPSPSGPGRPRSFDSQALLTGAMQMFWRRGLRATTTRDLERELGVSQSSLYNAFGSKDQILLAALDRYQALTEAKLITPLEGSHRGVASLERFFHDLAAWVSGEGNRGCLLVNLMAEDGGASEDLRVRTRDYRRRVRSALSSALERCAQLGEIDGQHGPARTEVLLGMALGISLAARAGVDDAELDGMVEATLAQIREWRTFA